MYLKQKELLWELDHDFIKHLMDITTKESHEKGAYIFHQGDSADHFYILIKGCVKLKNEKIDRTVYVVRHSGEIFGWSSIVGRGVYSVSAECLEPTMLNKIGKGNLLKLVNQNKENGMIFYKKVAEMLGNRLIHLYSPSSQHEFSVSQGTGQLQEIFEAAL
jgi:CRP/FNR family transcriptional regulator, cyclic AMP receptor protein